MLLLSGFQVSSIQISREHIAAFGFRAAPFLFPLSQCSLTYEPLGSLHRHTEPWSS